MRIEDNPNNLKGKELHSFLRKNKDQIIEVKKSEMIRSAPIFVGNDSPFSKQFIEEKKGTKAAEEIILKADEKEEITSLDVRIVANTTNFADSYMDVLSDGAYDETVLNDKNKMVHLHDHIYRTIAKVGIVKDVKVEELALKDLGLVGAVGTTQALVFYSQVMKSFNESIFQQYLAGDINQHSIGFRYQELHFASNDKNYASEYKYWEEFFPKIINKAKVEERGYFWHVPKVKIFENSAVILGANELTPTLSMTENSKLFSGIDTPKKEEVPPVVSNWERLRGK